MRRRPTKAQRLAAVQLYQHGALAKVVAEAAGVAPQTLARWVRQYGQRRGHKYRTASPIVSHERSGTEFLDGRFTQIPED